MENYPTVSVEQLKQHTTNWNSPIEIQEENENLRAGGINTWKSVIKSSARRTGRKKLLKFQ